MIVRLRGKPTDIVIVHVYMPTSDHDEEEVDEMYDKIEELLETETKGKDYTLIIGDWNAVVGEGKEEKYVGHYGLRCRNQRGEKLVEFCRRKQLCITNIWFTGKRRRRYTWANPGDSARYHIDYTMAKCQFRNSVSNAKTYPKGSDHNLVVAKVRVKLKKILKVSKRQHWKLDSLKDDITTMEYRCEVMRLRKELKTLGQNRTVRIKKPWVTDDMIEKMDERRKLKM